MCSSQRTQAILESPEINERCTGLFHDGDSAQAAAILGRARYVQGHERSNRMREIPKNMIGFSGKYFAQAMLMREGLPCSAGKDGIDLVVRLTKPRREFSIFVVSNLQPKRAGGKGKQALDWWIPEALPVDVIACVDLSDLRIWLFERDELPKFAQQRTAAKYHLYMYTEKEVALRGKKSMKFDYEFESYRLENRVYRGIFDKRPKRAAKTAAAKRRAPKKRPAKKRAAPKRAIRKATRKAAAKPGKR